MENLNASSTNPAVCTGKVLAFCNAGRLEHIDCTTLGFTECEVKYRPLRVLLIA